MLLLSLLQSASPPQVDSLSIREVVQYVGNAAAVGACLFAWRTGNRLTSVETLLREPGTGLVPRLEGTSKQTHRHASELQAHEVTLRTHDRELERLDRDKEPRRSLQPTDVGTLDRRKS